MCDSPFLKPIQILYNESTHHPPSSSLRWKVPCAKLTAWLAMHKKRVEDGCEVLEVPRRILADWHSQSEVGAVVLANFKQEAHAILLQLRAWLVIGDFSCGPIFVWRRVRMRG